MPLPFTLDSFALAMMDWKRERQDFAWDSRHYIVDGCDVLQPHHTDTAPWVFGSEPDGYGSTPMRFHQVF